MSLANFSFITLMQGLSHQFGFKNTFDDVKHGKTSNEAASTLKLR